MYFVDFRWKDAVYREVSHAEVDESGVVSVSGMVLT
jgi:hypothetical protein